MQAGGRNMTKFIVPFRNFTNAPKNRCTSDFKYQSKIYTIINDSCMLVKARSGNCGM